jgi:hypothetical protein
MPLLLHQKNIPPAIIYFLVYRSPRYPKIGEQTMYVRINTVCNNPSLD